MARRNKTKSGKRGAIQTQTPGVQQQPLRKVDAAEVRRLVSNIRAGTKLSFTYKREEPRVVLYLMGMLEAGILTTDKPGLMKMLIYAISESRSWDHDRNRTFEVRTTDSFDIDWFVDRVGSEVESFEVLK